MKQPSVVFSLCAAALLVGCAAPEPAVDDSPEPIESVAPVYPHEALVHGTTGWVRLAFVIQPDGTVSELVVAESEPAGVFDAAALTAVSQWRFAPRSLPQPARYTVRFLVEDGSLYGTPQTAARPTQPTPVKAVPPMYPRDALMDGKEGWVRLGFHINDDGSVRDVQVLASEPGRLFNAAAMRALEQWRFDPADAGRPAAYTIEFNIDGA